MKSVNQSFHINCLSSSRVFCDFYNGYLVRSIKKSGAETLNMLQIYLVRCLSKTHAYFTTQVVTDFPQLIFKVKKKMVLSNRPLRVRYMTLDFTCPFTIFRLMFWIWNLLQKNYYFVKMKYIASCDEIWVYEHDMQTKSSFLRNSNSWILHPNKSLSLTSTFKLDFVIRNIIKY